MSQRPSYISTCGEVQYRIRFGLNEMGREKGPAIIHPDGYVRYMDGHGRTHRTDGPAVIWPSGAGSHWVNGDCVPLEEFFLMHGVV